jgi:Tfp pilus assembly protein PilN
MKAVNLLPPELRGTAKKPAAAGAAGSPASGGAGPFVVLGLLALIVVAVAGYVFTTNTIADRETQLAQVKAEHEATMAQVNALKPYGDFQEMAVARVATVSALAASRFDWEQALRDLSRALPANVHLTKLDANLGGAEGGSSSIRGALTAPAIQLQGCTRTHSDVAALMSRLRTIRGVTRVSLASSDKEAQSEFTQEVASNNGQAAKLCPGGNPPSFDVVVFFEGSTAVATSAAATTTGGEAPAATPTPAPEGGEATPAPEGGDATPEPSTSQPTPPTDAPTTTPASGSQGIASP